MRSARKYAVLAAIAMTAVIAIPVTSSTAAEDADRGHNVVAALDVAYQAAVKRNDADTMGRVLADDFVLITGKGTKITKADLLADARAKACAYAQQDEMPDTQTVRYYGRSTAVVTALLWEKGTCTDGTTFDAHLWFSDTYVNINGRWRYVFGQASRPL
jgi:ketosteroid isomerase-like protein